MKLTAIGLTLKEVIKGTGATIAIRDLRYVQQIQTINSLGHNQQLAALIKYSNPKLLADFVEKYGISFDRQVCHYLLKYI